MSVDGDTRTGRHVLTELGFAIRRSGVPVTLELDVHRYGPAPGSGWLRGVGRTG